MRRTSRPRSERPQGQPTRGKTARNRLRRVDNFLLIYDGELIRRQGGAWDRAFFVDLGYGAQPITTLESAARLRQANPRLPVLGVEIDPERVAVAGPYADTLTQFRLGGFNLPLREDEAARAIRAFNVLRQYDADQVGSAWQSMGRGLRPGGLLIEGTSDPFGRSWTANLLRRVGDRLVHEGLLFSTNFHGGFEPEMFQSILPKNYIHRMLPGEPIADFMQAWQRAARERIAYRDWGLRQWFTASAEALSASGFRLDLRGRLLQRGYLLWQGSPDVAPLPLFPA
ncbi:MAG: class I SAM-dependent methyltransferase [Chloroflexi bacterium]|nr:class I SAM-dependent methyltransferase [Chloroflexota bacterium]